MVGPEQFTVTFRAGWIYFRRYRGHGKRQAMQLTDVYRLAAEQKLFAFVP